MKKILLIIMGCTVNFFGLAQLKTLDLSIKADISEPISPQKIYSITIINALAKQDTKYKIGIKVTHAITTPLSIPSGVKEELKYTKKSEVCPSLATATDSLINVIDESNIPKAIKKVQDEIKSADTNQCQELIKDADTAIASTTIAFTLHEPVIIGKGDVLVITITRGDTKAWTFTFSNEQPNHWTTYYGFTFVPDILIKYPNYYAKQSGGPYIISRMNDSSNKNVLQNISPTAMFTYRIFKHPDALFKLGLTGGIMYNTDILAAMIGPSLVLGDNITINTGITFIQKYKLKGQYSPRQQITENLDFSQLHDKIWSYDIFFSIGFNIPELFSKKSTAPATTASNN